MKALSTNCLYYQAYRLADRMAGELGVPLRPDDAAKADALKTAIHRQFWQADRQLYRYLVDPFGGCDRQEGLGLAFAVLFGVADPACTSALMERVHTDPAGIPCLWPSYDRYGARVPGGVGRHSGTVWPHVQGFWAHAALTAGRMDRFMHEFSRLAEHIFRDNQCAEIYHPRTGTPYGGLQELDIRTPEDWHSWCIVGQVGQATTGNPVYEWYSLPSNTWSATAYLRMVMLGLAGLDFRPDGIRFAPRLPAGWPGLRLSGLPYRQAMLDLHITGCGCNVTACTINGRSALPELPATATGPHRVELSLGD
jgi:glycogen debranching enzyme